MPRKLDEIAVRQRQREEEVEARRLARKTGGGEPAAAPAAPEPERTAPRLNLASRTGAGPSWRERAAAKEAAGDAPAPESKEELPSARKTGGYVPPHLRAGASATPAAPSRPAPTTEEKPSTQKWTPRWRQQQ